MADDCRDAETPVDAERQTEPDPPKPAAYEMATAGAAELPGFESVEMKPRGYPN